MSELVSSAELSLSARIEGLLFVATEPISPLQLGIALNVPIADIEQGLDLLENNLKLRGLRLQRHIGRVQLTTAPELAEIIEHFSGIDSTSRLSRAALETLVIIAYQQPVTRPQVDVIRGVNSDTVLRSLLSKYLIHEVGRADSPGRPILYCTTPDFLRYFGLNSISELPRLDLPVHDNGIVN
jgi:segregation and condensation protein B